MKRIIIAFLVVFISGAAVAQEKIESINFRFKLPNKAWNFSGNETFGTKEVWTYKRDFVLDSAKRAIVPNFAIITEPIAENIDVISYSATVRTQVRFDVKKVLSRQTGEISLKKAIGYLGTYEDKNGNLHNVYIVHAIYDGKGIQIIGDITDSVAEEMHTEMMAILKSIIYKKK